MGAQQTALASVSLAKSVPLPVPHHPAAGRRQAAGGGHAHCVGSRAQGGARQHAHTVRAAVAAALLALAQAGRDTHLCRRPTCMCRRLLRMPRKQNPLTNLHVLSCQARAAAADAHDRRHVPPRAHDHHPGDPLHGAGTAAAAQAVPQHAALNFRGQAQEGGGAKAPPGRQDGGCKVSAGGATYCLTHTPLVTALVGGQLHNRALPCISTLSPPLDLPAPWPALTPMQDTMAEMASDIKAKRTGEVSASADELFRFINKARLGRGRAGWLGGAFAAATWGRSELRASPYQRPNPHPARVCRAWQPAPLSKNLCTAIVCRCALAHRWTATSWSSLHACSTTSSLWTAWTGAASPGTEEHLTAGFAAARPAAHNATAP